MFGFHSQYEALESDFTAMQPPVVSARYDTLMPALPDLPASSIVGPPAPATNPKRAPAASTRRESEEEPPCEYCKVGSRMSKAKHHHHAKHARHETCTEVYEHVQNCPLCSSYFKRETHFLVGIIILLLVIIALLFFRGRTYVRRPYMNDLPAAIEPSFRNRLGPLQAAEISRMLRR